MSVRRALFLLVLPLMFSFSSFLQSASAAISEEERSFLLMYFKEEELEIISATRSLKSITRVAENVEVVTAYDIELMNAHTLAEVLNGINGVEVMFGGASPGSIATVLIQGSRNDHVVVFIDGVYFNDLGSGVADVSLIPAQIIDKVEVIKGPASSAWGSSLGGIINVITKSPPSSTDRTNGMVSGSYGQRNTGDFRAELTGRKDNFGYYLFAGRLQTDGLRKWEDLWQNNLYAKLSYDFSKDTSALLTTLYSRGGRTEGDYEIDGFKISDKTENILSSLSLKSNLTDSLALNVSAKAAFQSKNAFTTYLSSGDEIDSKTRDRKYGGSARLDWTSGIHSAVFGADYDFRRTELGLGGPKGDEKIMAIYANDTISVGQFSVIPGLRFDHTDIEDTAFKKDFVSPSLGVTYKIADKTLLRGYVARGFSIPAIAFVVPDETIFFLNNPDLKLETVWSYQIGAETAALKYFWLKLAAFRHDIKDAITPEFFEDGSWTYINKDKVRRQGIEAEIKTLPFYNFVLSVGATYVKSKDSETGEEIRNTPKYTYDIGLQYDDKKSFRALLKGHYIWFNMDDFYMAKYNGFVFDINMIKSICKKKSYELEAFLTAHNIFNGSQYWTVEVKNARRWIEGGIRLKL